MAIVVELCGYLGICAEQPTCGPFRCRGPFPACLGRAIFKSHIRCGHYSALGIVVVRHVIA
jgi:hypothetical protein